MAVAPLRVMVSPGPALDSENPYVDLLCAAVTSEGRTVVIPWDTRALLRGKFDILHVHWPEQKLRGSGKLDTLKKAAVWLSAVTYARIRGAKLVWTAHNLVPHECWYPFLERVALILFRCQVDLVIALSRSSLLEVRARYPSLRKSRHAVVPLGHYKSVYVAAADEREGARRRLGLEPISGRVVLFFGQIRPYKNVPLLVRCFRETASEADHLVIAGRPMSEAERLAVSDAAGRDPRVHLFLETVEVSQVATLFAACDLAAIPYSRVLNSATGLLALSLNRPVVLPATGSLTELRDTVGAQWVWTYPGNFTQEVMAGALARKLPSGSPDLSAFEWSQIGKATVAAYYAASHPAALPGHPPV